MMPSERQSVRITLGLPEGAIGAYWYLRQEAETRFVLSYRDKRGADSHVRAFAVADDAVHQLKTAIEGAMTRLHQRFETLKADILAGRVADDRPGFRPGHGLRSAKAGLQTFLAVFKRNEAALAQIQADIVSRGWPPLQVTLPWAS